MNESHSPLLQHVRDLKRVAYLGDIDYYSVSRSHRLVRIIDYKKPNESSLSAGERVFMSVMAAGIEEMVSRGWLHKQSGCYQLRAGEPFEKGSLRAVQHQRLYYSAAPLEDPGWRILGPSATLNNEQMVKIMQGEPL